MFLFQTRKTIYKNNFQVAEVCLWVNLFKLVLLTILNLKFQIEVINKVTYLKVIVFADY